MEKPKDALKLSPFLFNDELSVEMYLFWMMLKFPLVEILLVGLKLPISINASALLLPTLLKVLSEMPFCFTVRKRSITPLLLE